MHEFLLFKAKETNPSQSLMIESEENFKQEQLAVEKQQTVSMYYLPGASTNEAGNRAQDTLTDSIRKRKETESPTRQSIDADVHKLG